MQSGLLGNIVSFSLWSLSIAATASFKNKTILVVMPSESFLRLDGGNQVRVGSYLDEVLSTLQQHELFLKSLDLLDLLVVCHSCGSTVGCWL